MRTVSNVRNVLRTLITGKLFPVLVCNVFIVCVGAGYLSFGSVMISSPKTDRPAKNRPAKRQKKTQKETEWKAPEI